MLSIITLQLFASSFCHLGAHVCISLDPFDSLIYCSLICLKNEYCALLLLTVVSYEGQSPISFQSKISHR